MKIECITEVFVVDGGQIWRRGHCQHLHQRLLFDDLFQKTLYPGMPFDKQVAGIISRWLRNYGDISVHYKKVVDTDSGEIASYSKWSFAFTEAGGALQKPPGKQAVLVSAADQWLIIAGLPQNFKAEPPSTPEGLNDAFATEFTRNVREVRQRVLGERPQLRQFSLCPHS
jgi:hypothetical protein